MSQPVQHPGACNPDEHRLHRRLFPKGPRGSGATAVTSFSETESCSSKRALRHALGLDSRKDLPKTARPGLYSAMHTLEQIEGRGEAPARDGTKGFAGQTYGAGRQRQRVGNSAAFQPFFFLTRFFTEWDASHSVSVGEKPSRGAHLCRKPSPSLTPTVIGGSHQDSGPVFNFLLGCRYCRRSKRLKCDKLYSEDLSDGQNYEGVRW